MGRGDCANTLFKTGISKKWGLEFLDFSSFIVHHELYSESGKSKNQSLKQHSEAPTIRVKKFESIIMYPVSCLIKIMLHRQIVLNTTLSETSAL